MARDLLDQLAAYGADESDRRSELTLADVLAQSPSVRPVPAPDSLRRTSTRHFVLVGATVALVLLVIVPLLVARSGQPQAPTSPSTVGATVPTSITPPSTTVDSIGNGTAPLGTAEGSTALEPGRQRTTVFAVPFSFEVGEGWTMPRSERRDAVSLVMPNGDAIEVRPYEPGTPLDAMWAFDRSQPVAAVTVGGASGYWVRVSPGRALAVFDDPIDGDFVAVDVWAVSVDGTTVTILARRTRWAPTGTDPLFVHSIRWNPQP
jgi:hypothetical protein